MTVSEYSQSFEWRFKSPQCIVREVDCKLITCSDAQNLASVFARLTSTENGFELVQNPTTKKYFFRALNPLLLESEFEIESTKLSLVEFCTLERCVGNFRIVLLRKEADDIIDPSIPYTLHTQYQECIQGISESSDLDAFLLAIERLINQGFAFPNDLTDIAKYRFTELYSKLQKEGKYEEIFTRLNETWNIDSSYHFYIHVDFSKEVVGSGKPFDAFVAKNIPLFKIFYLDAYLIPKAYQPETVKALIAACEKFLPPLWATLSQVDKRTDLQTKPGVTPLPRDLFVAVTGSSLDGLVGLYEFLVRPFQKMRVIFTEDERTSCHQNYFLLTTESYNSLLYRDQIESNAESRALVTHWFPTRYIRSIVIDQKYKNDFMLLRGEKETEKIIGRFEDPALNCLSTEAIGCFRGRLREQNSTLISKGKKIQTTLGAFVQFRGEVRGDFPMISEEDLESLTYPLIEVKK